MSNCSIRYAGINRWARGWGEAWGTELHNRYDCLSPPSPATAPDSTYVQGPKRGGTLAARADPDWRESRVAATGSPRRAPEDTRRRSRCRTPRGLFDLNTCGDNFNASFRTTPKKRRPWALRRLFAVGGLNKPGRFAALLLRARRTCSPAAAGAVSPAGKLTVERTAAILAGNRVFRFSPPIGDPRVGDRGRLGPRPRAALPGPDE